MPPIPDVAFLYEGRASQDFQPDAKGLSHAIKSIAFRAQFRKLLRQLDKKPASILDFGCGSGQFTRVMGDLLPGSRVTGSDFHDLPPDDLAGRSYVPLRSLAAAAGTYDLVIAMHVLEHDDDTLGLLARIEAMASSQGAVVIEVPNIDCVWVRLFGQHWDAWYVPFHRTHFSRSSLRHRIEQSGLTVIAQHDVCVPTMGRTMANLFGSQNNLFWLLAGIALFPMQWLGEKLTGRSSALRVIARAA
jgi:SAM-dependent methyltransferase